MILFDHEVEETRYDSTTVIVHWIVVALVISLWVAGQLIDDLPDGPLQDALWSTHVVAGFLLALVLLFRIAWRVASGRRLAPVGSYAIRMAAQIVHFSLYGLLLIVVGLGIANALNRGYRLYGVTALPQIGDPKLKHALTDWHGLAANILLFVVIIHATAALLHHYLWRDGVLRRMSFSVTRPR